MTLEKYLHQKTNEAAAKICADAPVDSCECCDECEGHLVYENNAFYYECQKCHARWSTEQLEIDANGKFRLLELAD